MPIEERSQTPPEAPRAGIEASDADRRDAHHLRAQSVDADGISATPPGTASPEAEAPLFTAVLRPHRSLGPRGFVLLMAAICVVSFGLGVLFWLKGAWPVFGFCGLDVALVWFAFRANYRAARAREEIAVWPGEIHLRRISAKGEADELRLNPFWARLQIDRAEDEGVVRLALTSHGRAVEIGRFLGPGEREDFAEAFGRALARARSGEGGLAAPA